MIDLEKELTAIVSNAPIMPYYRTVNYLMRNGVTIQKWTPMTEKLPDIDADVLVCDAETGHMYTAAFDGVQWHLAAGWLLDSDDFTHWMPLPELPKGVNHTG